MSRNPAAAKYSPSASVETVIAPRAPECWMRPISTLLCVFTCGRNATPESSAFWRIRSQLRRSTERSTRNAGVGTCSSNIGRVASSLVRKIIHIDMDAFYASVEQRDDPALRGRPVIVGWPGERSVVCAASYEARKFGVHSAMPASRAKRLCPEGVFVAPDFERYRAVSKQIREIFERHTPLVEPLSLDEAYLDVTHELTGIPTATETAETVRREIREETHLTASAGVAPNKFLAKIASDWRKPDGLFVIRPTQVEQFLVG